MTAAIKTRLDAIDEQMAELQKEQTRLREELDVPDFVPGWYLSWEGDEPTNKENGASIDYCATADNRDYFANSWEHCVPFTPELAARFFSKTRYDWAKIVKEYPEAKWASTDENGRIDLWRKEPAGGEHSWGVGQALYCVTCGDGYCWTGLTPDWRDSLEARLEGM